MQFKGGGGPGDNEVERQVRTSARRTTVRDECNDNFLRSVLQCEMLINLFRHFKRIQAISEQSEYTEELDGIQKKRIQVNFGQFKQI